jgi:hypothetical protein
MNGSTDFVLERIQQDPDVTIGELTIGSLHVCFTCEDAVREIPGEPVEDWKIKGETAIPVGRYRIERTFSNRFQKVLPQLLNVPGFEGIRIHPGNTSADTEGCILPGLDRLPNGVGSSQLAYREVLKWIATLETENIPVWITIK